MTSSSSTGELPEDVKTNLSLDIAPLDCPFVFPPPKDHDVFSYKLVIGTKPGIGYVLFKRSTSFQVLVTELCSKEDSFNFSRKN